MGWKKGPALYEAAQYQPESKGIRKVKELLADVEAGKNIEEGKDYTVDAAIQYAVERGDMRAVNVLLQTGVDVEKFVYTPPMPEEEFQMHHTNFLAEVLG